MDYQEVQMLIDSTEDMLTDQIEELKSKFEILQKEVTALSTELNKVRETANLAASQNAVYR